VWVTFIGVIVLYTALACTTIYVLRGMSRRFRRSEEAGETDDYGEDVPYGPSPEPQLETQPEPGREPQEVPT
jgi:cytochrome d ubiquinol oxidase subunit I